MNTNFIIRLGNILLFIVFTSTLSQWIGFVSSKDHNEVKSIDYYQKLLEEVMNIIEYSTKTENDYPRALSLLEEYTDYDKSSYDANQLLGSLYLLYQRQEDAVKWLEKAYEIDPSRNPTTSSNLIEAYRLLEQYDKGRALGEKSIIQYPNQLDILRNFAMLELDASQYEKSLSLLESYLDKKSNDKDTWMLLLQLCIDHFNEDKALFYANKALMYFPNHYKILFYIGVARHKKNQLEESLEYYLQSYKMNSSFYVVLSNIGVLYQSLGKVEEARYYYELALPHMQNDATILNNYGALLGIMGSSYREQELKYLLGSLAIDPYMESALVNVAGYYQDEGLLEEAKQYLYRAVNVTESKYCMLLRSSVMLSPITSSWDEMLEERLSFERNLLLMNSYATSFNQQKNLSETSIGIRKKLSGIMDRIHFYIVYHGLNDRYIQELMMESYYKHLYGIDFIADNLKLDNSSSDPLIISNTETRRVRIGFMSKLLGAFEPHGLLLSGIMKYLPRSQFYVMALPVARTDGKPLSPSIKACVDYIQDISLQHDHAINQILKLNIDILVFADILSEPINHFLAFSRLAKIQIAFWGNPVTSGSRNIDYFISGFHLEHPYRTHIKPQDDPYSEQVILLEGQGIWYDTPISPEEEMKLLNFSSSTRKYNASREEFGLSDDWFLYFCPQSTFKIHPLYDRIFYEILSRTPKHVHLVVLGGRKEMWTQKYISRINNTLDKYDSHLKERVHVIERVSSERFIAICKLANVILHPFPFDGSRTSADSLIANVPYVTLPSEYLRGRMGLSFLRTMNIPSLVAKNSSDYVNIAIQLFTDPVFYESMRSKIAKSLYLIWEDMEVPFEWTVFLQRVAGIDKIWSWDEFIHNSGRNVKEETRLHKHRQENRNLFDKTWGQEVWLLDTFTNEAILESFLNIKANANNILEYESPWIFNNWNSSSSRRNNNYVTSKQRLQSLDSWSSFLTKSQFENRTYPARLYKDLLEHEHIQDMNDNECKSVNVVVDMNEAINKFHDLIKSGDYDKALELAQLLSRSHKELQSAISFQTDLGLLQYLRGSYSSSMIACKYALTLGQNQLQYPRSTNMMISTHLCIGIVGTYLNDTSSLNYLLTAWLSIRNETIMNQLLIDEQSDMTYIDKYFSSIFKYSMQSIDFSLISALKTFHMYSDCMDVLLHLMDIRSSDNPATILVVLMLSFIDWSEESRIYLNLWIEKVAKLQLVSNEVIDPLDSLKLIQRQILHVLDNALICVQEYVNDEPIVSDILKGIFDIIFATMNQSPLQGFHSQKNLSSSTSEGHVTNKEVVLLTQYFRAKNSEIQIDIDEALLRNLKNPYINKIVLLNEEEFDFSEFPNNWKIVQVNIQTRLTFRISIEFANEYLLNSLVVIANADVFFDASIVRLQESSNSFWYKRAMALLKWQDNGSGISLTLRTDSQDAWIFQSPFVAPSNVIKNMDFVLGAPRCDNRLAHLISISAGYDLINPAFGVHAIELQRYHRSQGLYGMEGAIPGDVQSLLISDRMIYQ